MRFKKGTKVEVWDSKGVPSGCWWPAVIISGNGHYYSIMHEQYSLADTIVDRVPRRAIRPCPPTGLCPDPWVAGDVVEVYDDGSWRIAEVADVIGRHNFLVKLLGSHDMYKVHASNVRPRLQWEDNQWFAIGKDFVVAHDSNLESQFPEGSGRVVGRQVTGMSGNLLGAQRGMKRGANEANSRVARRSKAFDEDGLSKSLAAGNSLWLPEKVDAISYPKNLLGEKYMLPSHNKRTRYTETVPDSSHPNVGTGYLQMSDIGSRQMNAYPSCSSSGSNSPDTFFVEGQCLELNECSDDAQSFCCRPDTEYMQPTHYIDVDAEEHSLALEAYRATLAAFYASGPISWDQEALITNLRLELKISNDEHLLEIRNLSSRSSKTM